MRRGKPLQRKPFRRKDRPLTHDERQQRDMIEGERQMAAMMRAPQVPLAVYANLADVPPSIMAKHPKMESETYRRYVSSFPCFECQAPPPSQCCHANEGKGMGYKVCDSRTFPLCPAHHEALDNSRGMTREARREVERRHVDRMQDQARADGREEVRFFVNIA